MSPKSNLPVNIADLERNLLPSLKEQAKHVIETEPVGGAQRIIRVGNHRKFMLDDQPLREPLHVVVIGQAHAQFFYEEEYDPDVRSSPVCFALAMTQGELKPDDRSPKKQNDGPCALCKQNAPGSGGRGQFVRACAARRRLAILSIDDKTADPAWASIELSPTAFTPWSKYVRNLAAGVIDAVNMPFYWAVTELHYADNAKRKDSWYIGARYVDRVANVRPDWITPPKGVNPKSDPAWFEKTILGRKVAEIRDGQGLLTPPAVGVESEAAPKGGRRRVKVVAKKKGKAA